MRIQGHLEVANRRRVKGWAQDRDSPDTPVSLVITVNGGFVARVIANKFRNDLQKVDGQGRLAFEFEFTECLSPLERVVIDVRSELDGTQLPRSPRAIERSSDFNPQMRQAVSDLLLSFHTDAEAEDRLGFLAEQTQAVLRTRQETRGGPNARQARRRLRWRNGLATEEAPPEKPRALFINDKLPVTVSDAGSNAVVSHMRSLARCGYEVNLIAANFSQERPAADLGEFIRLAWPWYCSVEDVLACHRNSFDIVYLHRINTASIYTTLVRHYQPTAHIIFSVADLSSLRLRRQAEREQRPELLTLVRQLAEQELRACQDADAIITHSSFEAALLRRSPERVNDFDPTFWLI
jgi:hypothetical protein